MNFLSKLRRYALRIDNSLIESEVGHLVHWKEVKQLAVDYGSIIQEDKQLLKAWDRETRALLSIVHENNDYLNNGNPNLTRSALIRKIKELVRSIDARYDKEKVSKLEKIQHDLYEKIEEQKYAISKLKDQNRKTKINKNSIILVIGDKNVQFFATICKECGERILRRTIVSKNICKQCTKKKFLAEHFSFCRKTNIPVK